MVWHALIQSIDEEEYSKKATIYFSRTHVYVYKEFDYNATTYWDRVL